jgi:hypothetical protein
MNTMRKRAIYLGFSLLAVAWSSYAAQDKPRSDRPNADSATTPVKIQIVFTEFEGDKKVKSLPYTVYHNTTHASDLQPDFTKLRIGSRIPIGAATGTLQYVDVGTNLDCRAVRNSEGRFLVQLSLEHSWIESDARAAVEGTETQANSFRQPVIRSVRSDLYLSLRDGQTVESTAAADPISGRIVRVEVTLNVLK